MKTSYRVSYVPFLIAILDAVIVTASMLCGFIVRFDFSFSDAIASELFPNFIKFLPIRIAICLITLCLFKAYNIIWRFIGMSDVARVTSAVIVMDIATLIISMLIGMNMSKTVYFLSLVFDLIAVTGLRVSYRIARRLVFNIGSRKIGSDLINTMIIGAGETGLMAIKQLHSNPDYRAKIVCAIDDNPIKIGSYIEGVPIVGSTKEIIALSKKLEIEQIIYAIPTASKERQSEILEICKNTGCILKILPLINDMIDGKLSVGNIRDIQIEDLLGRAPISLNKDDVFEFLTDKTILVTGGGGSIGSELCRQISSHSPKKLIILDIYENNAYAIEQELKYIHPELELHTIIASVRDLPRMEAVFAKFKPDVVFHAAAHKHVPLMETSPNEAIKNNVFGTYNTALCADKYGAGKFVLISTDKAVNPTNIMGASKRLCEMVVQSFAKQSETDFALVRFGNVLGSNGSVIPLFREQIKHGGPVLVTHPDIIRYFMTIPEAVSLVIQAGATAEGGEIFVLDMGKPVKIDDLARNLIKLSGFVPDVDIKVEYIGLRPGEKLYEELLMEEEGLTQTKNKLIYIGKPIELDQEKFKSDLIALKKAAESNSPDIKKLVSELVPTYNMKK